MPKLNLKGKISREKADRISKYSSIILGAATGLYFVIDLGLGGLWISPWSWLAGISLPVMWSLLSYRSISRIAFKRLLAFILLCAIVMMPLFVVVNVSATQSTAQNLLTPEKVNYFKTLLGRSYNYSELIVWENQHLSFIYGNIDRHDDPIKIYEYGKGRCQEFATLYATLSISQGYRCRIVDNIFNDHVFNEVLESNGTWVRVDASLNDTSSRAIGYPMFFEKEAGWMPPILALAFENSTITEVTSTYRSDGFNLLSPTVNAILVALLALCIIAIAKFLIFAHDTNKTTVTPKESIKSNGRGKQDVV